VSSLSGSQRGVLGRESGDRPAAGLRADWNGGIRKDSESGRGKDHEGGGDRGFPGRQAFEKGNGGEILTPGEENRRSQSEEECRGSGDNNIRRARTR